MPTPYSRATSPKARADKRQRVSHASKRGRRARECGQSKRASAGRAVACRRGSYHSRQEAFV